MPARLSRGGPELLEFALHELQVNVQGVEGVADLMGDAGRQQRQRLNPLALDGFDGLLAGFGVVVEDEGDAGAAGGFAIQRGGVEPEEARAGILDLKLVPHDALAARMVEPANLLPVELGDEIRDRLAFDVGLQAEEARYRLVEVEDAPGLIHDQDAVLDGVEERFEESPFARQALHDRLQTGLVQPPDARQHLFEETCFASHVTNKPGRAGCGQRSCLTAFRGRALTLPGRSVPCRPGRTAGAASRPLAAPTPFASARLVVALNTPATTLCSVSGSATKILPGSTPLVISPSWSFIA